MKGMNKKWSKLFALLIVFTMVLQFVGPVASQYSYAEEDVGIPGKGEETPEEGGESEDDEEDEDLDAPEDSERSGEGEEPESGADTDQDVDTEELEEDEIVNTIPMLELFPSTMELQGLEPRNLKGLTGFSYDVNLYDGESIINGVINIDELEILEYKVDFNIVDDFPLVNNDYLELDISSLSALGDIELSEDEKSGRIIFKVGDENIDAAKYIMEDGKLKITFDDVEELNEKKGRKGFVSLQFNVEGTSEEVELVEEIELEGMENKTFIVKRKNEDVTAISKKGEYIEDADNIEWTIDLNTELASLKNARLIDSIPKGLRIDKIEIINLKVTTEKITEYGAWEEVSLDDSRVTISGDNTLVFILGSLDRKSKRIKIATSIDDVVTGNVKFDNNAKLKADGIEVTDNDIISFDRITGISKSAKKIEDNGIEWTIEFRGNSNEGISDIVDILTLPSNTNLILDKASVTLDGVKFNDNQITIDDKKITFKDLPNSKELQTLKYTTKVIFDDNRKGSYDISNNATHMDKSDSASVTIKREALASKDNGRIYGDSNGNTYIEWKIEINKNNENWKDVVIEEKIPAGFEFVKAKKGTEDLVYSTIEGDYPIRIEVGESTKKETIIITTKLTSEGVVGEDVTNSAKIKWGTGNDYGDGIIGGGISTDKNELIVDGKFTVDRFKHTISKNSPRFSYKNGTVDWETDYKVYESNVENLKIEDVLTGDHEYIKDTINIKLNGTPLPNTNYTLTFGEDNKTFTITLNGPGYDKYNHIILTYQTKFDLSEMADADEEIVLKNLVKINNKDTKIQKDASRKFDKHVSKNGRKSVSKEPGENRIFNWTVKLNYKGKTIGTDKTIVDSLTGQQKYIKDSIKIYKAELDSNADLKKVTGNIELELGTDYSINYTEITEKDTDENILYEYQSGMAITFKKELKTPIILEYQTEAVGLSEVKYENEVAYNEKKYSASIGYDTHSEFITKKLLNDRNGKVVKGDVLKWELVINKSLSEIHNFQLEDIMSSGLIFIEDSLEITPEDAGFVQTELDGANSGKEGFKLTKDLLNRKHTITYETLVRGDIDIKEISNNVKISGYSIEKELTEVSKYKLIGRSEAGGSGYSDNDYKIKISKVDITGAPIKQKVEFKLITKTKIGEETFTSVEELITDNNGELIINLEKNIYNRYYIKEAKAPEGYILSDQEIEIVLSKEKVIDKIIPISIVNVEKIEITGTKKWVGGPELKPTIKLQLYKNGVPEGEPVELKNGTETYTWIDLPLSYRDGEGYKLYQYTIDEVETPKNYGKSADGLTITNTYKSPLTDIIGRKVWENGPSQRPTMELQLYKDGETFLEPVTLVNGENSYTWKDLDRTDKYGKHYIYTVKEVETPENYKKSEDGLTVTNTYVIPKTEVTGRKVWDGGSSVKPDIELQLFRDGIVYGNPVKLADGELGYTWKDLDITDINGKEYKYTIDEVNVPSRYNKSISEDGLTITNKYNPPSRPTRPTRPEPEDPKDPEDPEEPEKPTDLEPEDPKDPEDPTDPDEETDIDGDKPEDRPDVDPDKPDEETDLDGNLPGDRPDRDPEDKPSLPTTGSKDYIGLYILGLVSIIAGFVLRKRTREDSK